MYNKTTAFVTAFLAFSLVILANVFDWSASAEAPVPHHGVNSDFQFNQRPISYPSSYLFLPTVGDGTTASGGTPPAFLRAEPPDIPSNFSVSSWLDRLQVPVGGDSKFRTHCNYSHHAYEDPIVFPKKRGVSHLHTFFGNPTMGADSTYESLRKNGNSTCGGGPINRSGYWYPAVLKDDAIGDGKTMVVNPTYAIVYYVTYPGDEDRLTRIPRGLSYVFGFNPSDPTDTLGNSGFEGGGGYAYVDNGFQGWKCSASNGSTTSEQGVTVFSPIPGSNTQPYLRNADGTAAIDCPSNQGLIATLKGQSCWDGYNLTSPNGRKHVRQYDKNVWAGTGLHCPNGWWHIPTFELIITFNHDGAADYKEWYLASDRMPGATQFKNGESMHADWFGAWDYTIMKTWMAKCNGLTIPGFTSSLLACSSTQFGDDTKGKTGATAPDRSRNPWLDLTDMTTDDERYDPMPPLR